MDVFELSEIFVCPGISKTATSPANGVAAVATWLVVLEGRTAGLVDVTGPGCGDGDGGGGGGGLIGIIGDLLQKCGWIVKLMS